MSTADIEKELRAQIEKVVAAGVVPTHLDIHKHVHALPVLGKMSIGLARELLLRTYYESQKKPIYTLRETKSRRPDAALRPEP